MYLTLTSFWGKNLLLE